MASVTLPPDADIVLLVCGTGGTGKPRLIAYDVSSGTHARGSYRVFNFSSKPLSVILGEQRFTIAPRGDKSVSDPGWKEETAALTLQIATIADGKPTLVYSNFWEHYPQRRSLMFLFDGRHVSDPIIFSSFDVPAPPVEAP